MPAKTPAQRRLFGLALAVKKGEKSSKGISKAVKNIASKMSTKKIREFSKKK